jgi:glycosidase
MAASALMFTLDGVPLLYNGMEAGDATESGDPALFDNMTIFWQPKERPPLRRIYRDLIQLRKDFPAFRNDTVTWLPNSDSDNVVTLLRRDDTNEFLVVINFSNRPLKGNVNLPHSGEFKPLKFEGMPEVQDSLPAFRLNGFEWQVYHRVLDVAERGKSQEMASDAGTHSTSN